MIFFLTIKLFLDKHGQLGIWDARAKPDEVSGEDGETVSADAEGGKCFRLQVHWPATSKSSISCVKFDPVNAHNVNILSRSSCAPYSEGTFLGLYQFV